MTYCHKKYKSQGMEDLKETDNHSSVCIQTFLDDTYLFQRKDVLLSYLDFGSSFSGSCLDNQTWIKNFIYIFSDINVCSQCEQLYCNLHEKKSAN